MAPRASGGGCEPGQRAKPGCGNEPRLPARGAQQLCHEAPSDGQREVLSHADYRSGAITRTERDGRDGVDDSLNDHVVVAGVCETERHEIAVYEGLITKAEAMGEQDIVALLEENMEQEEAALKTAQQLGQQLAQQTAHAV